VQEQKMGQEVACLLARMSWAFYQSYGGGEQKTIYSKIVMKWGAKVIDK
jgi:hypothetical protein